MDIKYENIREIKSVEEMRNFTEFVLNNLVTGKSGSESVVGAKTGATILALSGDLGSGKTAFTQQLVQVLGIKENVTSPTFILQKKYQISNEGVSGDSLKLKTFSQIIHMDMYRIEDDNELVGVGFEEIVRDPKNLIVIEWPEKIADALSTLGALSASEKSPNTCQIIWINFEFVDETTRRVQW